MDGVVDIDAGAVEGAVGAPEQFVGAVAILRKDRHADHRAEVELAAADLQRAGQALVQFDRILLEEFAALVGVDHHRELVALDARHPLGARQQRLEHVADLFQRGVAGLVAEQVGDFLHPFERHHQRAEAGVARGRAGDLPFQHAAELALACIFHAVA